MCMAAVLTSHNIQKNCNIAIFYLHPCTLGFFSFDGLRRCSLYGKEWWAATSIGLWMGLHGAMCMAAVLTSHNIQKNCNIAIFYLHPCTLGFFHLMGCEDVLCMEKSDELRLPLGYEWICMVPCAWLLCSHPITFRKIATSRFFICTLAHWDFFIWWAAKMFFVWKRVMSCDFHWVMNGFAWRRVHGCCAHIP